MVELNNVDFRFVPNDSVETDNDFLTGRNHSDLIDFIDGGGGHDTVDGAGGSDVLIGGAGGDQVAGGDGGNMDFLLGGILDTAEGFDLEQAIAEASEFSSLLDDIDLSQVLAGLVNILDNATNLQDVVDGVTGAVGGDSSELQQAVGVLLEGLPQVLDWQQDDSVDTFKAAASSAENGVDIIFGYDDDTSGGVDLIDFSAAIDLSGVELKGDALKNHIQYDETTGAITDGKDNWFFVYSNIDPLGLTAADTVYVEVDNDVFAWDTVNNEWDMMLT